MCDAKTPVKISGHCSTQFSCFETSGPPTFTKKTPSYGYRDAHDKPKTVRFIMGVPILIRRRLLSEYRPRGSIYPQQVTVLSRQLSWTNGTIGTYLVQDVTGYSKFKDKTTHLSMPIAMLVNMDTETLSTCMNRTKGHIKPPNIQRPNITCKQSG